MVGEARKAPTTGQADVESARCCLLLILVHQTMTNWSFFKKFFRRSIKWRRKSRTGSRNTIRRWVKSRYCRCTSLFQGISQDPLGMGGWEERPQDGPRSQPSSGPPQRGLETWACSRPFPAPSLDSRVCLAWAARGEVGEEGSRS